MTDNDKKRFAVLMYWLAKKYPIEKTVARTITVEELTDYWDALKDIIIERLEWAAKRHFAISNFFPKPAQLRDLAPLAPRDIIPPKPAQPLLDVCTGEQSRAKLREMLAMFNKTYDTNIQI